MVIVRSSRVLKLHQVAVRPSGSGLHSYMISVVWPARLALREDSVGKTHSARNN